MDLIRQVEEISTYSKEKSKQYGQVFTPTKLIQEMCDGLPDETWFDSTKTFLDPCAGNGNFEAVIVTRLMSGLIDIIPDVAARFKHIMEKQIFMGELQRELARNIEKIFNPKGDLKLNIYVGDFLLIPDDYWTLSYEERNKRYPQHYVWDDTPAEHMQHGKPHIG